MITTLVVLITFTSKSDSQQIRRLTFDDVIEIAFERSYEVNKTISDYQRNSLNTQAARANLKSYSNIEVDLPSLSQSITRYTYSGNFYTSDKQRTTFEAKYSINQPFITNGTFSLNSNLLTFDQSGDPRTYQNAVFFRYTQPVLTFNAFRDNIWRAEERFKQTEYSSFDGLFRQFDTFNRLFYDLYKLNKEFEIDSLISDITYTSFQESAQQLSEGRIDSNEVLRLEVDFLLSRSRYLRTKVDRYKKELEFKQKVGLEEDDIIILEADLTLEQIEVDEETALAKGLANRPSLMRKEIEVSFRKQDIEKAKAMQRPTDYLTEFKGNLEGTFGVEKTDKDFNNAIGLKEYDKRQSLKLSLSLPLWDSGRKKFRVQAAETNYDKTLLEYDNDVESRSKEISRAVRNISSTQRRAVSLQTNEERAKSYYEQSLEKFRNNELSARDLSRAMEDYRDVQNRFLDAVIAYNRAILDLSRKSLWDFKNNVDMKEKFIKYLVEYK
jgi:hypothetical protein